MTRRSVFSILAFLIYAAGSSSTSASQAPRQPRLLLLLTIDQARAEYLDRFRPVLQGGLKTLLDRGAVFTEAHHYHAVTVTAPGHASLSTGRYPSGSGIVANDWYERAKGRHVYCVEDPQSPLLPPGRASAEGELPRPATTGRSPANLLATGLGDWIKAQSPDSKVFSIGAKDRASVLMGGKHADAAFWFERSNGHWVTSLYYMDVYPPWAIAFQKTRGAEKYFAQAWAPKYVPQELLASMSIDDPEPFSRSLGAARFSPGSNYYQALYDSPFIESFLFDFARILVDNESLGRDQTLDVLALSFASVDTVGHSFGPNSREILDTIMRLDEQLGRFLDFLDETVGLEHVAMSLSGDHGVAPVPERQDPVGRAGNAYAVCVQQAGRTIEQQFGPAEWFAEGFYFNDETLADKGLTRVEAEKAFSEALSACNAIERVWTRSEIEAASWDAPPLAEITLYAHSFHPDRSPDLYVQLPKWHMTRVRGTTHGTPHDYDTHVPAILVWPSLAPGRIATRIHTVDLPVTLAALLGVTTPDDVDGIDRSGMLELER